MLPKITIAAARLDGLNERMVSPSMVERLSLC
jgi:hypothetical protein